MRTPKGYSFVFSVLFSRFNKMAISKNCVSYAPMHVRNDYFDRDSG